MKREDLLQKGKMVLNWLKPWVFTLAIILVLKYSGLMGSISGVANGALLKTGIMDIEPEEATPKSRPFDYNFTLKDLDGNVVDFNQYKGKVVFINLWATWCGPCRAEMPSIQRLYDSVDKEQIVFVMLSLDAPGTEDKIRSYISGKAFSFPVFVPNQALNDQLRVPSIPTTFIISKNGDLRTKKVGTANYDTDKFRKYLNELVQEPTSKP